MSDLAEQIALKVYPENWITQGDFKHDSAASCRAVAKDTAENFVRVIRSEEAAKSVMYAFVRRMAGEEPSSEDIDIFTAYMSTALMALDRHFVE